jgi:hypothetical protein
MAQGTLVLSMPIYGKAAGQGGKGVGAILPSISEDAKLREIDFGR